MARDRNLSVWQAYVIVMSIVSFLCLGTLAWLGFTSGTNAKVAAEALSQKSAAEANLRKVDSQNMILKSVLGIGKPISEAEFSTLESSISGDAELDKAIKSYRTHMLLLGPAEPEKNYFKLVDTIMQELQARSLQLSDATAKAVQDTEDYQRKLKTEADRLEQAQKAKEAIALQQEKDLADYTAKVAEQLKANEQLKEEKEQQFAAFRKQLGDLNSKLSAETKLGDDARRQMDRMVRALNEAKSENFQSVQGEIAEVVSRNDGQDEVWINLGRADGLRPGVTFVVVDSDVTQATSGKRKATIEVLEVISGTPHLSRAKVLPDRVFVPVLRGDKIYSPFWQPGSSVQIALVGKMDIDGDGRDDRDRLVNLIKQNGCEIALDVSPSGQVQGRLSPQVRWMVVGDDLQYRQNSDGNVDASAIEAGKKRRELETEARSMGITIISPINLMNWLRSNGDSSMDSGIKLTPKEIDARRMSSPSGGTVSELYNRSGLQNGN